MIIGKIIGKIGRSTRSVSFLNNFFSALVGLGTFMLLTRVLDKSEFGSWAFFISVYTMLDMLRSGMLGGATVKFYTNNTPKDQLLLIEKSIGSLGVRITLIFMLVPVLYWGLNLYETYPSFQLISLLVVPFALVSLIPSMGIWFCQAKQDFKNLLLIRLIIQSSFLLFVVGGFIWDYSLNIVFVGYGSSWILGALYVLATKQVKLNWFWGSEKALNKRIFNYGKYTMSTLIGSNLLKNSDTYLIMGFLGEVNVARYNVADRILGFIDMPIRAFTSADFPRFVTHVGRGDMKALQNSFNKGVGLSIIVVWPIAVLVFFGAEYLIHIIAGPKYGNSSLILRIISIYGLLLPLDRYTGITIDALNLPKINTLKVVCMLCLNVILDIIVLSLGFGLESVAIVSVATYGLGVVYGLIAIRKEVKLQIVRSLRMSIGLMLSKTKHLVAKRE